MLNANHRLIFQGHAAVCPFCFDGALILQEWRLGMRSDACSGKWN